MTDTPTWKSTPLAKIEINDYGTGLVATHNYPCPVCRQRHAIYQLNDGIMQPCPKCQESGWRVRKPWSLLSWLAGATP